MIPLQITLSKENAVKTDQHFTASEENNCRALKSLLKLRNIDNIDNSNNIRPAPSNLK